MYTVFILHAHAVLIIIHGKVTESLDLAQGVGQCYQRVRNGQVQQVMRCNWPCLPTTPVHSDLWVSIRLVVYITMVIPACMCTWVHYVHVHVHALETSNLKMFNSGRLNACSIPYHSCLTMELSRPHTCT